MSHAQYTERMGSGVRIGVQTGKGPLESVTVTPDKPLKIGGATVSVDGKGQVSITGTEKDDKFSIMDGKDVRAPGSVVVGVESPGQRDTYLSIPSAQAKNINVNGGGGNDDYWAPLETGDQFVRIQDHQGDNWVTNIGNHVSGNISVADAQRSTLQREAGNVHLESSGKQGAPPQVAGTKSFLDSVWSWLGSVFGF